MIEGTTIPGALRIPVVISGSWSTPSKSLWEGVATANEPIVAVAFLRCQKQIDWGCSWRSNEPAIATRVSVSGHANSAFVQVVFSIKGGGSRWTSTLPSPTYRPEIPATASVETGTVALLARIEGDPIIDLLGLFLAKSDTIGGRNHIWHIRSCFHGDLSPLLKEPLTHGRSGKFED